MNQHSDSSPESGMTQFLKAIESKITEDRARFYPEAIGDFRDYRYRIENTIKTPIGLEMVSRLLDAVFVVANQVAKYLGEEYLHSLANIVNQLDYLILADSAGDENAIYGMFVQQPWDERYLVLALHDLGRKITKYEMAATIFHELVHAADPYNDKLDLDEYRRVYGFYSDMEELDEFTQVGYDNPYELVPRAYQGALFGSL